MLVLEIQFKPHKNSDNARSELYEEVISFYTALERNGQVFGEEKIYWADSKLKLITYTLRPDAFQQKYYSELANNHWQVIIKLCDGQPTFNILNDRIPKRFVRWQNADCLYLFTHALDITSAICSGKDGSPIPAYLVPITEFQRERLFFWTKTYRNLDRLWLDSGSLEMKAYKEMAKPNSSLSKEGRQICKWIEDATNKPTYLYLIRYWGWSEGESERVCPLCGRSWNFEKDPKFVAGIYWFDFLCQSCRIVSHIGSSSENERYARIGEFRKRSIKNRGIFQLYDDLK